MTRPLDVTQKQIEAIAKGAAKAGHIAEVKIGNAVIRLIHKDDAQGHGIIAQKQEIVL